MPETIKVPQGARLPVLVHVFRDRENKVINLTGGTNPKFRMRPADGTSLSVDGVATIASPTAGKLTYGWGAGETDTPGVYMGWWRVELGGLVLESPEEPIVVDGHAPGQGIATGPVVEAARLHAADVVRALSDWSEFGTGRIQAVADTVKLYELGTIIAVSGEPSLDGLVIDYLGICTAIDLIPSALTYWLNQHQQINATGEQESVSYPDRLKAMENLLGMLTVKRARALEAVGPLLANTRLTPSTHGPAIYDEGDGCRVTDSPATFPSFNSYPTPRRSKVVL